MSIEGTEHNGPWWLQVAAWCGLLAMACMGAEPGPVARDPEQPTPPQQIASERAADRVATWVLGKHRRMVRRKVRAAARLLVLPQQGPGRPLVADCVHASSLLPSRARPGTVFLIVSGALHVVDTAAARPVIAAIATRPANIVLVELLAATRAGTEKGAERATELLALARPAGAQSGNAPLRLWHLVVEGNRATGSLVGNAPWLRSREAFFERFHAPRCRDDGSDCLRVEDRGAFLDVQPNPGAPRHEWKKLEAGAIHDATWNPAARSSALALVVCDEQSP